MSDRAWEDLIDRIDVHFGILKSNKFDRPLDDQPELIASIDQVDFKKGPDLYRIERISSPAIVDKKTTYNKTGVATRTQTVYDDTETVHKVHFYRLEGSEAVEISPDQLLG